MLSVLAVRGDHTMSRSTRTLPSFFRLAAVLVVAASILGACGSSAPVDEVTAAQGPTVEAAVDGPAAAPPSPGPDGETLPTLPAIDDRRPEQFTAEGCAATASGPDCGTRADQIDEAQAGDDEHDWRVLAGFVGTRWSTSPAGSVDVLVDTVTSPAAGIWWARGLVRNGTEASVGELRVRATLLDASGAELATVEAPVGLPVVRPGEPAPFELVTDAVDVDQVQTVVWSTAHEAAAAAPVRDLEWTTYWQRVEGDPRPVDNDLFTDPSDGSRPFVLFGTATLTGGTPVEEVLVLGAWIDPTGRIQAISEGIVGPSGDEAVTVGASVDVVLTAAGVSNDAQVMVWVSGP